MAQLNIEVSDGVLAAMRADPESLAQELRIAAAVKWYEIAKVSQGRAAEIAGLTRAEFLEALGRFGVSPFQESADELVDEATVDY